MYHRIFKASTSLAELGVTADILAIEPGLTFASGWFEYQGQPNTRLLSAQERKRFLIMKTPNLSLINGLQYS